MKTDTQHLDYLLSQYVDGCLDGPNRKSLEQRLTIDRDARELYNEHREMQDVLDDWGSRIPLIHWDEFDGQLARRLETETVGGNGTSIFRRWVRPLSIAAGLAVAASLGYGWHAYSRPQVVSSPTVANSGPVAPSQAFKLDDSYSPGRGSRNQVRVEEGSAAVASSGGVNVIAPGNVEATDSLKAAMTVGLPSVGQTAQARTGDASSAHVALVTPAEIKRMDKDGPAYP